MDLLRTADVVVIGGGVMGVSTADHFVEYNLV
jgi:glycine/D-amino acid oxidase-like deaminating enzyme